MTNNNNNTQTTLYCGDCVEFMRDLPDNHIDMTITSPPYDNLRNYDGYSFDFENTAKELYRITKNGGVVVWIVADATIKGGETGTSFRQVLFFMSIGFVLHDTMIWNKQNCGSVGSMNRYENVFEYMFILSKGKPKTANIIKDRKNKRAGEVQHGSIRQKDGSVKKTTGYGKRLIAEMGRRRNVWDIFPVKRKKDRGHPAPYPLGLAKDHILSWSNPDDLIFDPFLGSGTTGLAAIQEQRRFIGCDVSQEYIEMSKKRMGIS